VQRKKIPMWRPATQESSVKQEKKKKEPTSTTTTTTTTIKKGKFLIEYILYLLFSNRERGKA
jgi:hypothetical protein